jgi:hypothetical protein
MHIPSPTFERQLAFSTVSLRKRKLFLNVTIPLTLPFDSLPNEKWNLTLLGKSLSSVGIDLQLFRPKENVRSNQAEEFVNYSFCLMKLENK